MIAWIELTAFTCMHTIITNSKVRINTVVERIMSVLTRNNADCHGISSSDEESGTRRRGSKKVHRQFSEISRNSKHIKTVLKFQYVSDRSGKFGNLAMHLFSSSTVTVPPR